MLDNYQYPSQYELQEVLGEICSRRFLNSFAQQKGIFVSKSDQQELAEMLSFMFFQYSELEEIRRAALSVNLKDTLAGFRVLLGNPFDLIKLLDEHRNKIVDDKNDMKMGAILAPKTNEGLEYYTGEISYVKRQPGKVQFLQGDERSFEYYVKRVKSTEWEILVKCTRPYDVRVVENWLEPTLRRENQQVDIQKIDQDQLTTEQTIEFFDELGSKGAGDRWRLVQVKKLTLRREQPEQEEDEVKEAPSNELSGITQAILEGTELRNNPFVRQCEKGGYRFTSMTYEYHHKSTPFVQIIRAEFKKKPKVFEISLDDYKKRTGKEEKLETEAISEASKFDIHTIFWHEAKLIYDRLRR